MAYPYLINAASQFPGTADLTNFTANQPGNYGPFGISGDTRYVFTIRQSAGNHYATCWKSTNAGVTWSEQDTADRPQVYVGSGRIACAEDGTTLWVFYVHPTTQELTGKSFDTGTDSWGTAVSGGPIPDSSFGPNLFYAVRTSSGNFLLPYASAAENVGGDDYERLGYARFDGSTWTDFGEIDGQAGEVVAYHGGDHIQAITGSSGRVHLFVNGRNDPYGDPFVQELFHVAIESDDTVGTWQAIDRLDETAGVAWFGQPTQRTNGANTEIICGYSAYNGGTPELWAARANSATTPTWTTESVEDTDLPTDNNASGSGSGALIACGSFTTRAYMLWITATDIRYRTYEGSGWSAATSVYTDTICNISIQPFPDDIGIILTPGTAGEGDCYYYELGVVPPEPPVTSRAKYYSY